MEIPPGGESGWHLHRVPSVGRLLQGTLEVTLKDGRTVRIEEGQGIAEPVDVLHIGRNVGTGTAKVLIFYIGTPGLPLTVREGAPAK